MTTASYHHGNLRQALVDAAVAAARERGPEGLAVRELARTVGVSHNAAYRHFADREALVDVVAERGMAEMVVAMDARLSAVDAAVDAAVDGDGAADPVVRARDRLSGLGRGYVDFAVAEPGLFRVLFTAYPELPTADHEASDPFTMLNAALDDLVGVGFLAADARPGAEVTCWAAVHGFSVLCVEGPLRALPADLRDAALDVMLASIDRSYGATTSRA